MGACMNGLNLPGKNEAARLLKQILEEVVMTFTSNRFVRIENRSHRFAG